MPELSDLVYEKSMGAARFMKSIRARHQDGVVLVKVIVKPYVMKLEKYKHKIIRMSCYEKPLATNTNTILQENARL